MKNSLLALLTFLAFAVSASLHAENFSPEPGFTLLLNDKDLTGWHHQDGPALDGKTDAGDGRYTVKDGALSGNSAKGRVLLWTTQAYPGNFILRFEFRAAEKCDGGLFFNKTQLQCGDYGNYAYKSCKSYKPNDWNAIEVTVQGSVARCTCNGELLEAALKIAELGQIGFEADKQAIEYRRIRIKILP